jgi:GT2 family glycosyltransferase
MISIITAVFNQLAMNIIFAENLAKNTFHAYELIVIDNGSTDGSPDFFESIGATVIRNSKNFSYPHSQNQGIAKAKFEWLAFLNNDIIISPNWDKLITETMIYHNLEVATCCGIEKLETSIITRKYKRRWKLIRGLVSLLGTKKNHLLWMHKLMYPDWEGFCKQRNKEFEKKIIKGFVGNSVMIQRTALEKIGLWDERIQNADFDLYLRVAVRSRDFGDIKPVHIALDCFVHHYIRLTLKAGYPPFYDQKNIISLDQKWSHEDLVLINDVLD